MSLVSLRLRYIILERKGYSGLTLKDILDLYSCLWTGTEGAVPLSTLVGSYATSLFVQDDGPTVKNLEVFANDGYVITESLPIRYFSMGTFVTNSTRIKGMERFSKVLVSLVRKDSSYMPLLAAACVFGFIPLKAVLTSNSMYTAMYTRLSYKYNSVYFNKSYEKDIGTRMDLVFHKSVLESCCCYDLGISVYEVLAHLTLVDARYLLMVRGSEQKKSKFYHSILKIVEGATYNNNFMLTDEIVSKYPDEVTVLYNIGHVSVDDPYTVYKKLLTLCSSSTMLFAVKNCKLGSLIGHGAIEYEVS